MKRVMRFFQRVPAAVDIAKVDVAKRLSSVETGIYFLLRRMDQLMAKIDTLASVLAQINTTTNDMAAVVDKVIADDAAEDAAFQAEIDRLKAIIAAGGTVTEEQLDALIAQGTDTASKLAAISDALKATGADPANPAPALPPDVGGGEV